MARAGEGDRSRRGGVGGGEGATLGGMRIKLIIVAALAVLIAGAMLATGSDESHADGGRPAVGGVR
jgi:hypothetical protein